jgi:hypothetical protein
MATNKKNTEIDLLKEKFRLAVNAAGISRKYRNECEQFYYNDVDKTKSQFTGNQRDSIERTYNIPVSTKFTYAIIEHLLSFYTATKPFPKYMAAENSVEDFPLLMHKLFMATWYECKGYKQIEKWIRDSLNTGDGFLIVRKSNFYTESTTNVVIEQKSWKHLVVDPECKKIENYEDADYLIVMDVMRRRKAEKLYDIKISSSLESIQNTYSLFDIPNEISADLLTSAYAYNDKDFYVAIIDFYEKESINVYICSNPAENLYGIVTNKRPKSIEIPNPEKAYLKGQIDELQKQISQQANQSADLQQAGLDDEQSFNNTLDSQTFNELSQNYQANKTQEEINEVDLTQQSQKLQTLLQQYHSLPSFIPAFEIEVENQAIDYRDRKNKDIPKFNKVVVTEVIKQEKKQVKKTLIVGDSILDRAYLPTDEYPIINLPYSCGHNPNDVYGVTHYINDVVKGMNKYLSQIQLDMAINAHRKGFYWKGTVANPKEMEERFANPGAFIELEADPSLQDNGKPIFVEHSPLNQSFQFMLEYFKQLIEYITGVHGVIQGDSTNAPSTYGATQSLQSFGTQRIKLFSRSIEIALERLAYVVAKYLQAYCPRDKVIQYFDDNGDQQEAQMLANTEDYKFKVRVDIGSSLPTTRQSTGQQLAFLAQTFSDDSLKSIVMQYMLKIQDVPEAREIAEKLDIVKQLQSQVEELSAELKQADSDNRIMQNQMTQKEAAHKVREAQLGAEGNLKAIEASQKASQEMVNPPEENNILDNDIF